MNVFSTVLDTGRCEVVFVFIILTTINQQFSCKIHPRKWTSDLQNWNRQTSLEYSEARTYRCQSDKRWHPCPSQCQNLPASRWSPWRAETRTTFRNLPPRTRINNSITINASSSVIFGISYMHGWVGALFPISKGSWLGWKITSITMTTENSL